MTVKHSTQSGKRIIYLEKNCWFGKICQFSGAKSTVWMLTFKILRTIKPHTIKFAYKIVLYFVCIYTERFLMKSNVAMLYIFSLIHFSQITNIIKILVIPLGIIFEPYCFLLNSKFNWIQCFRIQFYCFVTQLIVRYFRKH